MNAWHNGEESVVYGCIKDVSNGAARPRHHANRDAILALPDAEDWPVLNREMFAVPTLETAGDLHTQIVHVGSSYCGIEYEWSYWLQQFEGLLRKMYWVAATVHLETALSGRHSFVWKTGDGCHRPGAGAIEIRCEWSQEDWLRAR